MNAIDIKALAGKYGVSVEQMRQQFLGQAAVLRKMQIKAEKTGRKVNGYAAVDLKRKADETEQACVF